jgi:hypothetical protein
MDEEKKIVKNCQHHGELTRDQVVNRNKKADGTSSFRCKYCLADSHKKHYEKHKKDVLAKQKIYRKENPEKIAKIKRESRKRNLHKHRNIYLKKRLIWEAGQRNILSDGYMKHLLRRQGIAAQFTNDSLVNFKRVQIQVKRLVEYKTGKKITNGGRK